MFESARPPTIICLRSVRALESNGARCAHRRRTFRTSCQSPLSTSRTVREQESDKKDGDKPEAADKGAMTRRLTEMSETSLEEGGRSARNAVEEAGFDDELKQRLLDRIADASFAAEHRGAIAQASIPTSAPKEVRDAAAATPWAGTESLEDAALRMLNDARKPIRRTAKIPSPFRPPKKVDTGRPRNAPSSGARLANARDRSSIYSIRKDQSMTEKEKEEYRKELKDRFSSGARPLPATLQGLTALANERIEDAIARGQFKNLPRGQKLERDYNMSSPFLDTTEYFMNKIIKKQEIVPPWIEKQQELVSAAGKFRSRLRADWRRHAARMISSRGGSLEAQIRRAEQYAAAEARVNPSSKRVEKLNAVDSKGHMSQITLTGKLETPKEDEPEPAFKISVIEDEVRELQPEHENGQTVQGDLTTTPPAENNEGQPSTAGETLYTFRDPQWVETERSYLKAAVENLNSMTRSYNLMAPNLAKKPYFSLDRELRTCFADVASQIPKEIYDRSRTPPVRIEVAGHTPGGVLEKFGGGKATVYDERRPQYGFKEFWRDLFGSKETQ